MADERNINELEKENQELRDLLEYYYGCDAILEKAETLFDEALKAKEEIQAAAEEIDRIKFDQDFELEKRKINIERKEREAKRLLNDAQKKSKDLQHEIDLKAKKKNDEYKKFGIRIIIGLTALYTVITFMVYLAA